MCLLGVTDGAVISDGLSMINTGVNVGDTGVSVGDTGVYADVTSRTRPPALRTCTEDHDETK